VIPYLSQCHSDIKSSSLINIELYKAVFSLSLLKKDLMVQQQVHSAFEADASVSSHPLSLREDDVITPDQIKRLFGEITYNKVSIMC